MGFIRQMSANHGHVPAAAAKTLYSCFKENQKVGNVFFIDYKKLRFLELLI
jgi:hypothetical protein